MKTVKKIIRLDDKRDNIINHIKDLLKLAEEGKISMLMTASDCIPDGEDVIMTGYYNCDFFQRQLFISAQQMDLAYMMVESNVDKLIEIINE